MEPGAGRAALAAKQLVVSGAGRGAMELGRSAANLLPHCNKRVLMRSLTLVLIMVSKKRMFGEEIQRNGIEPKTEFMGRAGTQIQMKFRREMHLEKKTVVVSMADRATKRVQQCSGGWRPWRCVFTPTKKAGPWPVTFGCNRFQEMAGRSGGRLFSGRVR